jgi:hypothetical protein
MALPGFISLARKAKSHFGADAIREADAHLKLAFSTQAFTNDYQRASTLAFASHYFMDRFSAGHIRTEMAKLSGAEAQRRHDYDCTRGLDVTFDLARAVGAESHIVHYHDTGDRCLLSPGGAETRAILVLALWRAIAGAREGMGLGGVPDDWFPRLAEGNPPVPRAPGIAKVTGGSGVGSTIQRPGLNGRVSAGMSAMLHLELLTPIYQLPAETLQMAYFGGDGTQLFVPLALQTSDSLIWLYGLAAWATTSEDTKAEIWRFRESHRDIARLRLGNVADVTVLYPFVGWAIIRSPKEAGATNFVIGTLPVRLAFYDRFSLFISGSATTRDFKGYRGIAAVHVGIDL